MNKIGSLFKNEVSIVVFDAELLPPSIGFANWYVSIYCL